MNVKKIKFMNDIELKSKKFPTPEDKNENGFKMFMLALFIGPPGRGKTYACIKLAKYLQKNNLINEIILISSTQENNPFYNLDIPEENKIRDLGNVEDDLLSIINYCNMRVEKWRNMRKDYSEKQYNEIYKKILKLYKRNELKKKKSENIESDEELDEEDYEMLEDNK